MNISASHLQSIGVCLRNFPPTHQDLTKLFSVTKNQATIIRSIPSITFISTSSSNHFDTTQTPQIPDPKMTDSGSFIKIPTPEEEERMRKAAEESQKKREEAQKKREALEMAVKAGESSQSKRKGNSST